MTECSVFMVLYVPNVRLLGKILKKNEKNGLRPPVLEKILTALSNLLHLVEYEQKILSQDE